ncbi:hypothetical protein [Lysinibacillus sphaericus]|uniref:hypothetical protein n=1 Tax=Lysinibacillus sphaericus TaxID=1421 RepID=UPI0015D49E45|nr:hypothetical protein [Lysinibacillus sphaericus]
MSYNDQDEKPFFEEMKEIINRNEIAMLGFMMVTLTISVIVIGFVMALILK